MALERVRQFGRMLDQASERYREGLAGGRTPARVNVERSINQVEDYLSSPLTSDPFVDPAGPEGWDGLDAWRGALADAVRTQLRPAFARSRDVLHDVVVPAARHNDRCGRGWLDERSELYQALIKLHTGLPLAPSDLHDVGMAEVTEALPRPTSIAWACWPTSHGGPVAWWSTPVCTPSGGAASKRSTS